MKKIVVIIIAAMVLWTAVAIASHCTTRCYWIGKQYYCDTYCY